MCGPSNLDLPSCPRGGYQVISRTRLTRVASLSDRTQRMDTLKRINNIFLLSSFLLHLNYTYFSITLLSSQGSWRTLNKQGASNGLHNGRLSFLGGHLIMASSRSFRILSADKDKPTLATARPATLPITPPTSYTHSLPEGPYQPSH